MLNNFMKICFAGSILSAVAGLACGPLSGSAMAGPVIPAWGDIVKDGNAGGTIRVTSGDGQSWTSITSSQFSFPVAFSAHALEIEPLNRVWVVQGGTLDVNFSDIYDTDDPGTGLQGPTFHSDTKTLFGDTLKLTNNERNQIIAACNAKLKPFANEQPQHQTETQIPVSMVMQTTNDGVGWSDGVAPEGINYGENWKTVNFTLPVICEGFTRAEPATPDGVATPHQESEITKVELALSKDGTPTEDTLVYSGSCPTGITLNMGWFTTLSTSLKSYVQHKSAIGSHDWSSPEFSVTTNQPAAGGEWKKEMTDFMSIPFAGQAPAGGGQAAHDVPNSGLQMGGSGGGGGTPQNGFTATNTGDSGVKRYMGFFRVVAYKGKKTVPAAQVGGGWTNIEVYSGKKFSPWRKYDITCEPKQSTVALDSPKDFVNPPKTGVFNPDDGPAFPRPAPKIDTTFDPATRDLTGPVVHKPDAPQDTNGKTTALKEVNPNVPDRIKALAAEARRKQAAAKVKIDPKRVSNAAIKARQMKLKADADKRAQIIEAARKARLLKLQQDRARLAAQQAATARANALRALTAKRTDKVRVAPKRRTTTAPAVNQLMLLRAR